MRKKKKSFECTLRYVTRPTDEQLEKIKNFIYKKYVNEDTPEEIITFDLIEDKSLGGGFILKCGNEQYNWSTKGRTAQFTETIERFKKNMTSGMDVMSILRTTVEEFELAAAHRHVGYVTYVGDGIATVAGLPHAAYGEILLFECGIKGMVQDIRPDEIAAILFGPDREIRVGSRVARTVRSAGVPVGEDFLGRVVNALGSLSEEVRESLSSETVRQVKHPSLLTPLSIKKARMLSVCTSLSDKRTLR